jgi:hypothetical protein
MDLPRRKRYRKDAHHGLPLDNNPIPAGTMEQTVVQSAYPGAAQYKAGASFVDKPGRSVASRGRTAVEPKWPSGGYMMTRPTADRNYTVQAFTGYPTATVGAGKWQRGKLVRTNTPTLSLATLGHRMYDPTDVTTWDYAGR